MAKKDRNIIPKNNPEEDKIQALRKNLQKMGYEMPSLTKFKHDLSEGDNIDKLYKNLDRIVDNMPSQETFKQDLGIKKKEDEFVFGGSEKTDEEYIYGNSQDRQESNREVEFPERIEEPDESTKRSLSDFLGDKKVPKQVEHQIKKEYGETPTPFEKLNIFEEKVDSLSTEYANKLDSAGTSLKEKYQSRLNALAEEAQYEDKEKQVKQLEQKEQDIKEQYKQETKEFQQNTINKQQKEVKEIAQDMNLNVSDNGDISVSEEEMEKFRGIFKEKLTTFLEEKKQTVDDDSYGRHLLERLGASSKRLINDLPANAAAISERMHNSVMKAIRNIGIANMEVGDFWEYENQTYWQDLALERQEKTQQYLKDSQHYNKRITQLIGDGEIGKAVGEAGLQIIEQVPQLLIFAGTAGAGSATTGIGSKAMAQTGKSALSKAMGQSGKGLAYVATSVAADEYVDMIDIDMNEFSRVANALTTFASEYTFESLTTIPILKGLKKNINAVGKDVVEREIKTFFEETYKRQFKRIFQGLTPGALESAGEVATELTQQWSDALAGVIEPSEIGKNLGDVAITSFAIGEGMYATGSLSNIKNKQEARQHLKKIYKSLPDYMNIKSRKEAMELIVKKERLESLKEKTDENLRDGYDLQIKQIDQQLKDLSQNQYKASEEFSQAKKGNVSEQKKEAKKEGRKSIVGQVEKEGKETQYKIGTITYKNKEEFLEKVKQFKGEENVPNIQIQNDQETANEADRILSEGLKEQETEKRKVSQKKKEVAREELPEVEIKEIKAEEGENSEEIKQEYDNVKNDLLQLEEGENTTGVDKKFAKIRKKLPQKARDQFTKKLKEKQKTHETKQQKIAEEGGEIIGEESGMSVEAIEMMDKIEDPQSDPVELTKEFEKNKDKFTAEERRGIVEEIKQKQEEIAKQKNQERKEQAKTKLDEGFGDIMDAIGGIEKVTGEERAKVHEGLKKIAEGAFDYTMVNVEEFFSRIKENIKQKIPQKNKRDEIFKELDKIRPDIEAMFNRHKKEIGDIEGIEVKQEGVTDESLREMQENAAKKIEEGMIDVGDFGISVKTEKGRKRAIKRAGWEGIVERRAKISWETMKLNWYVMKLRKNLTKEQREVIPFLLEKTGVPKKLGRKDLEEAYNKYKDDPVIQETVKNIEKHFKDAWEIITANTENLSNKQIQNYVTHIWNIPANKKSQVTNWFATKNKFLNKRYISTLKEGIEKFDLTPKELDISEIVRIHGSMALKVIVNNDFLNYIRSLHDSGHKVMLPSNEVTDRTWVEYNHPAVKRFVFAGANENSVAFKESAVKVDPALKPVMDAVLGQELDSKFIRAYQDIGNYFKKAQLSISFFHHVALTETALAKMGAKGTLSSFFKTIRSALEKGQPPPYSDMKLSKLATQDYLIQLGASQDINVAKIQKNLDDLADFVDNKVLGKNKVAKRINILRGVAKFNKVWDTTLWEYLHDGLKLYAVESIEQRAPQNLSQEELRKWKIEQGQLINDTFGGQNWDVLLKSPRMVQWMRWCLLSPDWTISTVRQALAFTGFGNLYKSVTGENASTKEKIQSYYNERKGRMKEGGRFWLKAAMYFGVGMNLLNVFARKKDKRENPQYYVNIKYKDGRPPLYKDENGYYFTQRVSEEGRMVDKRMDVTEKDGDYYHNGKKLEVEDKLSDLMDYTMFNNTIGQETYLFDGRYGDGSERYVRWGKQFREFPELIHDESGFSIGKPFVRKLGGKASPQAQIISQLFTGNTLSGYENWDMKDKESLEWMWGALEMVVKSSVPFALSNTLRSDKEFYAIDMAMPSAKGMTASKAVDLYKSSIDIEKGEFNHHKINQVYIGAVKNGLDAFGLFQTAISSSLADQTSMVKRSLKDLQDVNKKIKVEEGKNNSDPLILDDLHKKKRRLLENKAMFDHAMEIYPKMQKYMEAREREFIKNLDDKIKE